MTGLVGDIGGTRARFGLVGPDGTVTNVEVGECGDHAGLADALHAYLAGAARGARPRRAALSVACPVTGDRVSLTNHPWSFSIEAIRRRFHFETLAVVNDFSAVARSVPLLGDGDRMQVGGGRPVAGAAIAVLGPGTGLGVSGLVPASGGWAVIEGEGGHVTMAASGPREAAVLAEIGREFEHVSAERGAVGSGSRQPPCRPLPARRRDLRPGADPRGDRGRGRRRARAEVRRGARSRGGAARHGRGRPRAHPRRPRRGLHRGRARAPLRPPVRGVRVPPPLRGQGAVLGIPRGRSDLARPPRASRPHRARFPGPRAAAGFLISHRARGTTRSGDLPALSRKEPREIPGFGRRRSTLLYVKFIDHETT